MGEIINHPIDWVHKEASNYVVWWRKVVNLDEGQMQQGSNCLTKSSPNSSKKKAT